MTVTRERLQELTSTPLPRPGDGRTWERWHALAAIAEEDLAIAKLVEPHHDAVAIAKDLGDHVIDDGVWAVWASEPPFAVLTATPAQDRAWRLDGRKAFCSGAELVSAALVTAVDLDGRSRLFALDLAQDGIEVDPSSPWVGPGMRDAQTVTLALDGVTARAVGEPGDYVDRPGFWHGAIGVAACWWGGARGVAGPLESATRLDDHGLAHRGAVRAALHAGEAVLRQAATSIDAAPEQDAEVLAQSVRAVVADVVETVVRHVGRATGPGPLAFDADHARRVADLEVFVRQHHAERDLARLGSLEVRR